MQASPFAGVGLGPFEDAGGAPASPLDAFRHGSGSSRDARCEEMPRGGKLPPACGAGARPLHRSQLAHGTRRPALRSRLLARAHGIHPNRHCLACPLRSRSIHRRSLDDAGLLPMATSAGGGAALPAAASLGSLARSASVSNPFDVTELLARISLLPATPAPPPALASTGGSGGPRCLSTDGVNRMQWVQPSGEAGLLDVTPGLFNGQTAWGCTAHGVRQRVDLDPT